MKVYEIVNRISNGTFKSYLEIGVANGDIINKVEIARKVGVSPNICIPLEEVHGECHLLQSDTYFGVFEEKFDCILIDGIHTYEQSKRDFINSIERLNEGGIILIDDCIPRDELSALPDFDECLKLRKQAGQEDDYTWMGDVYKTIIWINDYTNFSYALIHESDGIVAVWKDKRKNIKKIFTNEDEIQNCEYEHIHKIKSTSLHLKSIVNLTSKRKKILSKILNKLMPHGFA